MENALPRLGKGAAIVERDSSPHSTNSRRSKARLIVHRADASLFSVSGKTAHVVRQLATRPNGITPLDLVPWCMRLSSIIHQLRHRYGLKIETVLEPHKDGFHARYFLRTPVKFRGA